ncbi:MAG TPA: sporulation protein [Actinomycetes bacterium]
MVTTVRDAITVKRVFAEPYEKDGVTVIAAATVAGGGGGGGGHDERGQEGEGGGFGVMSRPAGAYVIRHGDVQWRPAVDVNRLITVLGAVAIAYLLSRPRIIRARAKAARRARG